MASQLPDQFFISNLDLVPLKGTNFSYELKTVQDTYDRCAYSLILVEHQGYLKDKIETYMIIFNNNSFEANGDRSVEDKEKILEKAEKKAHDEGLTTMWRNIDALSNLDKNTFDEIFSELKDGYTQEEIKKHLEQKGPFRDLAESVFVSVLKEDTKESTYDSKVFNGLEQSYYRSIDERLFVPGSGGSFSLPFPRQSTRLFTNRYSIEKSEYIFKDGTSEPKIFMKPLSTDFDYDDIINNIPEEIIKIMNIIPRIPKQIRDDFTEMYNASRKEVELRELILF